MKKPKTKTGRPRTLTRGEGVEDAQGEAMSKRIPRAPAAEATSRRRAKLSVRALVEPPEPEEWIVATIERALKRKLVETELKELAHFCVLTTRMFSGPFKGEASTASGPGEVLASQWVSFEADDAGRVVATSTHWPSKALDAKQRSEALALIEQAEASLGGRRHLARALARGEITPKDFARRNAQTFDPDGSRNQRIEGTESHLADLREWIERMPPGRSGRREPPNGTDKCLNQIRRLMLQLPGLTQAAALDVVVSLARPFDDSIEEESLAREIRRRKKPQTRADR